MTKQQLEYVQRLVEAIILAHRHPDQSGMSVEHACAHLMQFLSEQPAA